MKRGWVFRGACSLSVPLPPSICYKHFLTVYIPEVAPDTMFQELSKIALYPSLSQVTCATGTGATLLREPNAGEFLPRPVFTAIAHPNAIRLATLLMLFYAMNSRHHKSDRISGDGYFLNFPEYCKYSSSILNSCWNGKRTVQEIFRLSSQQKKAHFLVHSFYFFEISTIMEKR